LQYSGGWKAWVQLGKKKQQEKKLKKETREKKIRGCRRSRLDNLLESL
jgi:hypothetical protein